MFNIIWKRTEYSLLRKQYHHILLFFFLSSLRFIKTAGCDDSNDDHNQARNHNENDHP